MISISPPAQQINALVKVPGSKSISNRVLILNFLCGNKTTIHNLSDAEDTLLLQKALAMVSSQQTGEINVNHAGTSLRFLCALLSLTPGRWVLAGSSRLKQRPITTLINALRDLGADIRSEQNDDKLPFHINGKELQGGPVEMESQVSSQFISALLLSAPAMSKPLQLHLTGKTVSAPYIDLTIEALERFGAKAVFQKNMITVQGPLLPPTAFTVETDWSSASYYYSLVALSHNAQVEIPGLQKESRQADAVLSQIYTRLGVTTVFKNGSAVLRKADTRASPFHHDFSNCPDIAQTVAVTCFGLGIPARLCGLDNLKKKESDRIESLAGNLKLLGAQIKLEGNCMEVSGALNTRAVAALIKTHEDHRVAMSFAPLCLVTGQLLIEDEKVVAKSYPLFWDHMKSLGFKVHLTP